MKTRFSYPVFTLMVVASIIALSIMIFAGNHRLAQAAEAEATKELIGRFVVQSTDRVVYFNQNIRGRDFVKTDTITGRTWVVATDKDGDALGWKEIKDFEK